MNRIRTLPRWLHWIIVGLAGIIFVALALGLYGFWIGPASLRVQRVPIELEAWPPQAKSLTVAVLADLHTGSPFNGLAKLETIVDRTNAQQPDLILLPGDFVIRGVAGGDFVPPEDMAPILAELKAPLGVWAVLGNHDWWFDAPRVQGALEAAGILFLEDRAVRLEHDGGALWLVGVSDAWEGANDIDGALAMVEDDVPILLMTHNPETFPLLPDRVDLSVAGHTHGGQVYIPFIGRPIVPVSLGERWISGLVVEGGQHFYISNGLGTSIIPVRFLVPPEISLLEIRPVLEDG